MKTSLLFAGKKNNLMTTFFLLSSFLFVNTAFSQEHKKELLLQEISHQSDSKNASNTSDKVEIAPRVIEAAQGVRVEESTSADVSIEKASQNHITKTIGGNTSDFISENRPEDKLHPEYGKVTLPNMPESKEITRLRTANSRTFVTPDGGFAMQKTYGTFHYEKDGVWHSIQDRIEPVKGKAGVYGLEETDLPIFVDTKTGLTQMQLNRQGEGITFGVNAKLQLVDQNKKAITTRAMANPTSQKTDDNTILLTNIWDNIDRRQTINYWQVKTDYIIKEKPLIDQNATTMHFSEQVELPTGWSIKRGLGSEMEHGWQGELLILDANGAQVGTFGTPVYYDSSNHNTLQQSSSPATITGYYIYTLEGNTLNLTTVVPTSWLLSNTRVYPVVIDPSTNNTYSSGNIETDFGFQTTANSSTCPGLLTVTIPTSATITSVDVTYRGQCTGGGVKTSEQRTQLRCTSIGGTAEGAVYAGGNNSDQVYTRTGLTIANGVVGGGGINFALHAGRTTGTAGCVGTVHWILNNTWTVTVFYYTTYYSYQNGNWESADTWTTDPSGTLSVNPAVPGSGDGVVILNGRTVNITTNTKTPYLVEIRDGAILNLGSTTGHTFDFLTGTGFLRLSSGTLPAGDFSAFVAATGGTIEFYGNPAADFIFGRNTFNNLIINFSNTSRIARVGGAFTINGNLTVTSGDFRLGNDATARTLTANKDITIEAAGKFSVHTAGLHIVNLHGDLTVNSGGSFKLHNLAEPNYTNTSPAGKADLRCIHPTAHQYITANGPIEPYWLIVNKGTDHTYMVDIQASSVNNFRLFGYTIYNGADNVLHPGNLDITNGTLKLGPNIVIPQISHRNGWLLPLSGHLWLDGAEITTTIFPTYTRANGIYIFGKLTVTGGKLNDNSLIGIITRQDALIEVDGGILSTSLFRPSNVAGVHRGAVIIRSGVFEVRRDIDTSPNATEMYASFNQYHPDNVFIMSGGELNILQSSAVNATYAGSEFSLFLGMNPSNIQITGGTINIHVPESRNAKILTTSPIYNLNISSTSSSYKALLAEYTGFSTWSIPAVPIQPLVIQKDFNIQSNAVFDADNQNVTIGQNFTLGANARYIPGNNITTFNGAAGQLFTNTGAITDGLFNLNITNTSILSITNNLAVRFNMSIGSGTIFHDMGYRVTVAGNVANSGTHQSQGTGSITLNGAGNQFLTGDGTGVFGNLSLNKAEGRVTTSSNFTINGNLRLANVAGILYIGSNRLTLSATSRIYDALSGTSNTNFDSSRMVETNGLQSAAGLVVNFASTDQRIFPIGSGGKYTPATMQFTSAPTQWGSVRITPANSRHPLVTSTNSLNYYWKVSNTGFTGIAANSLRIRLYYDQVDVTGTEGNYEPGVYTPVSWKTYGSDKVSEIINEILFDTHPTPQGDFTAGEPGAFGALTVYYSRQSGGYDVAATWSPDPSGSPIALGVPTASDPVIIQNEHIVTVSDNNRRAGTLTIENGGTLDLGVFTGHNFGALNSGAVIGSGLLRISSNTATSSFPLADWGEFLAEGGGTVEYYTIAHSFALPGASTPIFTEGFQDITFPPTGWTRYDLDGSGTQWARSTARGANGSTASALHAYSTNPAGGQNGWLVTPAINFSTEGNYTLNFYRYCVYPTYYRYHGIYVSVGSANPADNQFVEILEIGAGSAAWTKHSIDLSSYAGYSNVYIAFVYKGYNGDDFYLDDVEVVRSSGIKNYNNLIVNTNATNTITFSPIDLTVYSDLTVKGTYWALLNGVTGTTLNLMGNLNIQGTSVLRYPNTVSHTVNLYGNATIDNGASLAVGITGTAVDNIFNVYGNIVNNGTMNLRPNATYYGTAYFLGTATQTLSGTGATTNFHRVFVNKGSNQTSVLNVTSTNFTVTNTLSPQALTILNGTIRFNGPTTSLTTGAVPFNIPETACLSVAGGAITVGGDDNASDITLAGKIEVSGGTLTIGAAAGNNFNNDIEIAGGGVPAIDVSGGTLNVNGQVRRSITSTAGALRFSQSGGAIVIFGRQRNTTRALLEVTNAGSEFNNSAGTLTLVYGLPTATARTFGELYLEPQSYNVTGGTIIAGTGATTADHFFDLYLACPVWNLTVDGTTTIKTARLKTFPATFKGTLQIGTSGGVGSMFNTSGLDVNIGGDMVNYSPAAPASLYVYNSNNQNTTFFGQSISQSIANYGNNIRFGTLSVNNTQMNGKVSVVGTNIFVFGDVNIQNGELENSSIIYLYGDVYNYSVHSSTSITSYLQFHSTNTQNIYGSDGAKFGALLINNNKSVISHISVEILTRLHFNTDGCRFNIGSKNLKLHSLGTLSGFSLSRYITTNGVLSDLGVTREWSGTGSFTLPIGVVGKYTPVTLNVTNTGGSAGSITVKPINRFHPATFNAQGDELQYYWNVSSSGFGATPTVNHIYNYLDGDAMGTDAGYVGGRYDNLVWTTVGSVSTAANTLTLLGVNYIDGEYTAGLAANFVTKPPLYSLKSGDWNNTTDVWSTNGTDPCVCAPNGNPVFIRTGHTITSTANNAFAYSVDIEAGATLDLAQTIEHNLGHVTGGGTLKITSTVAGSFVFPGGTYEVFMNTDGSTVEYTGTGTLPSNITTYQNVTFLGGDTYKYIPAANILVQGHITINEGFLDNRNYNRNITVYKNWLNNIAGGFLPGTGTVSFEGGLSQIVQNTAASETFYNLAINKTANHVTLNSNVVVSRTLTLTRGNFITDANTLYLSWTSTLAASGGSSASFVDGNLSKMISSGSSFIFPVGNGTRYGAARVFGTSTTGNQYWTVRYFDAPPTERSNLVAPLQSVSDNEYWTIQCAANGTANVRVRWDALSSPMPVPNDALHRQKLRVAQYVPGWTNVGQLIFDFGATNGTIQTSTPVSFITATNNTFTVGVVETATAKIIGTVADLTEFCDDGSTLAVIVELTGDSPWSFTYNINGGNSTNITNVGSSPYNLIFNYEDLFAISGVGNYLITLTNVQDNLGRTGTVLTGDATLILLATPNPTISGPARAMINATSIFTVPLLEDNSYSWSVSGVAITSTSGADTNEYSVEWAAATGTAIVELTQTNDFTGCSRTVTHTIVVANWPVIIGPLTVIAGSTESYHTMAVGGHKYKWTVVGGDIVPPAKADDDDHTVTIHWNGLEAAGLITLEQGPNETGFSDPENQIVSEIILIGADPLPIELLSFSGECTEGGVVVQWVTASEINNDYFVLERSESANNWHLVKVVEGQGTTSMITDYSVFDPVVFEGVMYYQLTQNDFDGKFVKYGPVSVVCSKSFAEGIIIHRLSHNYNKLNVVFSSPLPDVVLEVFDITGKPLLKHEYTGNSLKSGQYLEENLFVNPGVYILRIYNKNEAVVRKFMVR
jgi:hypothetical protein